MNEITEYKRSVILWMIVGALIIIICTLSMFIIIIYTLDKDKKRGEFYGDVVVDPEEYNNPYSARVRKGQIISELNMSSADICILRINEIADHWDDGLVKEARSIPPNAEKMGVALDGLICRVADLRDVLLYTPDAEEVVVELKWLICTIEQLKDIIKVSEDLQEKMCKVIMLQDVELKKLRTIIQSKK